ncbi:MAG: tRNA lysidine(34) synthetase TilS [Clostridia bacterium]
MSDRVYENIIKHHLISEGEKVLVGVSGGPDSICLLHVLFSLKEKLKIELSAIHINHMIRGKESDGDESFTGSFCDKLGIEYTSVNSDVSEIAKRKKVSSEEAGRLLRYREFEKLSNDIGASKIAVAHNLNDQAETIIMHIVRGTGLDGLKGMDFIRGKIIRPFLNIGRDEIEDYCDANNLNPRIDSSNLTDIYTRNRVRLKLIPYMNELLETDIVAGINKMSALIRDDSQFLDIAAEKSYNECLLTNSADEVRIDIPKLTDFHISVLRRVIRCALNDLIGNLKDIETVHIESISNLVMLGASGSVIQLPRGIRALKDYNSLKLYIESDSGEMNLFRYKAEISGRTLIDELKTSIIADVVENPGDIEKFNSIKYEDLVQYFDYDKIKGEIFIRNRRDGDLFKPLKSTGTKKLKEYFIDKKIAREKRDEIPLAAVGNEILWIIGHKVSDNFIVDVKTKRILRLEYCKE